MARRAHGVQPRKAAAGHLQSLLNDAVGAFQSGDDERVIATCRQVLATRPGQPDALNLLGIACQRHGHVDDAIAALSQAAKAAPRNADIHNNLGVVLASLARHAEAAASFEAASRLNPRDHQIRANLGRAYAALERWGKAVEQFGLARRGDPRDVDLLVDMARACGMTGDIAEAERCCRAAIEAAPARPGPHKELAVILRKGGRRDEALAQIEFALAAQPESPRFHVDRGLLLSELARYDDAVAAFDRALALDPDFADARYGRALVNLLLGRFGAAWADYRSRESLRDPAVRDSAAAAGREFHRTPLPADLAGRHVTIVRDQGLGDEIFFLRFVPALAGRKAEITYRPDSRLAGMIERAGLVDRVSAFGGPAIGADYTGAVADLPYLLGAGDNDPPPPSIRLPALPDKVAAMRARLAACGSGPYIGVTWRAGTVGSDRALRKEVPLDGLAAALAGVPGTLVALQRSPPAGEIDALARAAGRPVHDLSALNPDLEAMLALSGLLDLYVTVSNTNLHLRVAQGRTCHVLVPAPPEFRWMAQGGESPWFPASPLYRQQADGDWGPALAALKRDLESLARHP